MPTFPVDLEAWFAPFQIAAQTIDLGEGVTVQNRTAGGQVLRSGGAQRLWRGSLTFAPMQNEDAAELEVKAHVLRGVGAYFTMRDYRRSGTIAATLATVQANGTVNISGGPANGVIRTGDYIAFDYAGNRALHQVVTGGALSGTGVRNGVEVRPSVLPGWTGGTAVTIGSSKFRAVIDPGSVRLGVASGSVTGGISFDWVQLLRSAA